MEKITRNAVKQLMTPTMSHIRDLLPHQKQLRRGIDAGLLEFPFYVCWSMGSGKTIGGCIIAQRMLHVHCSQRVLVLCNLIIKEQWQRALDDFAAYCASHADEAPFFLERVEVRHFDWLDKQGTSHKHARFEQDYAVVIVDEAHQFNSVYSQNQCPRLRRRLSMIQRCPRVVYMSGTPVTESKENLAKTLLPLHGLMQQPNGAPHTQITGRVSYYDMKTDPNEQIRRCIPRSESLETKHVPMSWAQVFVYYLQMRKDFSLTLPVFTEARVPKQNQMQLCTLPELVTFQTERYTNNRYNSCLKRCCFNPFVHHPRQSPKICQLMTDLMDVHDTVPQTKQIVYSFYKDSGTYLLSRMWSRERPKSRVFVLTGDINNATRDENIRSYNECKEDCVLFATWVGGLGIHFCNTTHVYVVDPPPNAPIKQQMIDRAVRYMSHDDGDRAVVHTKEYVMVLPASQDVDLSTPDACTLWINTVRQSGVIGIPRCTDYFYTTENELWFRTCTDNDKFYVRSVDIVRALRALVYDSNVTSTIDEIAVAKHSHHTHDEVKQYLKLAHVTW